MEKPNSIFKKKEATEVCQSIGQFAQAAPGAVLKVMLRVLEQAYTEIVIKPEDWEAIDKEIQANTQKGVSTEGGGGEGQSGQQQQQADPQQLVAQMDPRVKAKVVQMHQQGVPEQQIVQFIQSHLTGQTGATNGAQSEPAR